jgi:Sporulation protein and related proteins
LSLEEYLYTVVPSEMPIKFGLEALKVQAIASRSYAIRCFKSEGYAAFGAHVDDSTASQVYNSIAEQPIAVQAVDETRGLVGFSATKWLMPASSQRPVDTPPTFMKCGMIRTTDSPHRKCPI